MAADNGSLINVNDLANRLYRAALEKFDGNKRKAIRYLSDQSFKFASRADKKRRENSTLAQEWSNVYHAYSTAQFRMSYHLELDEEFYDDLDNVHPHEEMDCSDYHNI